MNKTESIPPEKIRQKNTSGSLEIAETRKPPSVSFRLIFFLGSETNYKEPQNNHSSEFP